MNKLPITVYNSWVKIMPQWYKSIHGTIRENGGKVVDLKIESDNKWIIFYEMPKSQESEFEEQINKQVSWRVSL